MIEAEGDFIIWIFCLTRRVSSVFRSIALDIFFQAGYWALWLDCRFWPAVFVCLFVCLFNW